MSESKLTLVIATKDRPQMVRRQLDYYKQQKCEYKILIGDSSTNGNAEEMYSIANEYSAYLNISYNHLPEANVGDCQLILSKKITTRYSMCVADGAFAIVKNIPKLVDYLDKNPEYVMAHGKSLIFTLKGSNPYGKLTSIGDYSLPISESDSSESRFTDHLSNYRVSLYCVMKTEVWKKIWRLSINIPNTSLAHEVVPCCLSIIIGKCKEINTLYLVRHIHTMRPKLSHPEDWVKQNNWNESRELAITILASTLSENTNETKKSKTRLVAAEFDRYIRRGIERKNAAKKKSVSIMQKAIKILDLALNPLRAVLNPIRFYLTNSYETTNKYNFMSKRHPFHKDLKPLVTALQQKSR